MFDNNFGKCEPIYQILLPIDSLETSLCIHRKISTSPVLLPHLQYVATLPCKTLKSKNVTEFAC